MPDVSADANPYTGYSVYCTATAAGCTSSDPWIIVGGTSAAAPLWAGIAADLNQYLAANSMPVLGSASAMLYSLFNTTQPYTAYHDVNGGNNLYYPATSGYDLASGIGTPDVWNIARDLYDTHNGNDFSISANPTGLSIAEGSSGTSIISTAVTNGSAGTVSLSAIASSPGLTVSLNPTAITAGGSSTLTINVSPSLATGFYNVEVTGTEGGISESTSVGLAVTYSGGYNPITNGGFDNGNFNGWTRSGSTIISNMVHTAPYAAQIGAASPYRGDSSISQTFTVPSGYGSLSIWYNIVCHDTVNFDWATISLVDNTSGSPPTIMLPHTCSNTNTWVNISTPVTVGDSYTITITDHDDNYPGDPTYLLVDDIQLANPVASPFINGGFEGSNYTGWTTLGTVALSTVSPHGGTWSAVVGSFAIYPGDSSISQTVAVPLGATTLTFWYKVACHDTVAYDWATATLRNNTTVQTTTVLPHTCTNNDTWYRVTANVVAGDSYTLTLIDHDDDWVGDPTYTFFDDVSIS